MSRAWGRGLMALSQGIGQYRNDLLDEAERKRRIAEAEALSEENTAYRDKQDRLQLLTTPGVTEAPDAIEPKAIPVPVGIMGGISAVKTPGLRLPNPEVQGMTRLQPGEDGKSVYFDPEHKVKEQRRLNTPIRDLGVRLGIPEDQADVLYTNPTLIDDLRPKLEKPNGWTYRDHQYSSREEMRRDMLEDRALEPPSPTDIDRSDRALQKKVENQALLLARGMAKGADESHISTVLRGMYPDAPIDVVGAAAGAAKATADRERLAAENTRDMMKKRGKGKAGIVNADDFINGTSDTLRTPPQSQTGAARTATPTAKATITQDQADYLMQMKGWTQEQVNAKYTVR